MGRKSEPQSCPLLPRARFAALDIGSSAIRYRVVEWVSGASGRVLESRRFPVSLGESVFRTGRIRKNVRQRAEEGLKCFARALDRWQVADYRAVATSAVRESVNGREWTAAVRERFHLDVDILSGEAEARLVHQALEPYREPLDRPGLLADLGGGSLELVAFRGPVIRACDSLPLGTVRSGPLSRRDPFPLSHRLLLEEARESFRRRVDARLTELERVFDPESDDPLEVDLPSPKVALELLSLLGEISMKPARGRVKDLAKVADFLEFAEETAPKKWFHALPDAEED